MTTSPQLPTNKSAPKRDEGRMAAGWTAALASLAVVVGVILFLYRDTMIAMVTIWYRSDTFNHAFMVPPISLWLMWRRRLAWASHAPEYCPIWLVAVAATAFLWLLGDLAAVNSLTQLALVAMLVAAVPTLLGVRAARQNLFPLAFLFFAVPIGEFLMPWFMEMTADFTVSALRLSGIPVLREGLQFVIPTGNWSVVEACSGIRYLIASVTVGTLFAYLNYQTTSRRVVFVLVSILVPIVANWIRAYSIVLLGHLSGNTLAVGVDHLIYGWLFFGVVILMMFVIGARWSEPESLVTGDTNLQQRAGGPPTQSAVWQWTLAIALVVVAAAPQFAKWMIERNTRSGSVVLAVPVGIAPGWAPADAGRLNFAPGFENPSAQLSVAYEKAGALVGMYLGYYRDQNYSRKLVSSVNVLVGSADKGWSKVSAGTKLVRFGQREAAVRAVALVPQPGSGLGSDGPLLAWQIYWIDGTLTANDYMAKAYSALYQIAGYRDDSAVVIVYARKDSPGGADALLSAFLADNYSAIDAALRQARAGR